jgi:hypothetical protein
VFIARASVPDRGLSRSWRSVSGLILVASSLLGCATIQELAALRRVDFTLDRVDQVRIAGVRVDDKRSYSDLSAVETGRLAAAVLAKDIPLDLVVHVRAANPPENSVSARLVDLDWTLFLEDRETVSGRLAGTILLPPGEPVDVPIGAHLDLLEFFRGSARDLFELALSLSGQGGATKEIRLEALPTVQTSLGPIRYPGRIVIRREVGGR